MRPASMTLAGAALALLAALPGARPARAAIEEGYVPGGAPVPTTWYGASDAATIEADREYIRGMRPHHAGALTMARDYLADPAARSPALRRLAEAIIRNQSFEIGLLDDVARNLDRPPVRLGVGPVSLALQPMATEGVAQRLQFIRSPIPGVLDAVRPVSARDVQFAKAMTVHHQAALDMARAYQANPAARNGFLALMNVDIVTDQSQEIALMRAAVAAYEGDAAAVVVEPGMVHGMEGMAHHDHP